MFTQEVPVHMPDVAQSMDDKNVSNVYVKEWCKQEGDIIYREMLCTLHVTLEDSTKFTLELETDDEEVGLVDRILVEPNVAVPAGTLLCTLLHPESDD